MHTQCFPSLSYLLLECHNCSPLPLPRARLVSIACPSTLSYETNCLCLLPLPGVRLESKAEKGGADFINRLDAAGRTAMRTMFPQTYTYFVRGAPAMLLHNVNPAGCLANGTSLRYESLGLTPASAADQENDTTPDTPILLPEPPTCVYVSAPSITASANDSPVLARARACGVMVVDGVPIFPSTTTCRKEQRLTTTGSRVYTPACKHCCALSLRGHMRMRSVQIPSLVGCILHF